MHLYSCAGPGVLYLPQVTLVYNVMQRDAEMQSPGQRRLLQYMVVYSEPSGEWKSFKRSDVFGTVMCIIIPDESLFNA